MFASIPFQSTDVNKAPTTGPNKIAQTLEATADTVSKNEVITERLVGRHGKLSSAVYKLCREECLKTLKLTEVRISRQGNEYQKLGSQYPQQS